MLLNGWTVIVLADEAKDEAIRKDRQKIEGTWKIISLEVNGNQVKDEDADKLTVVNGADGTWRLVSAGKEISAGTSDFDPTRHPKTIDFTPTASDGGTVQVGSLGLVTLSTIEHLTISGDDAADKHRAFGNDHFAGGWTALQRPQQLTQRSRFQVVHTGRDRVRVIHLGIASIRRGVLDHTAHGERFRNGLDGSSGGNHDFDPLA